MQTAKETTPQAQPLRVPPEEKFWQRYSPHGEAPLSFAGSFAIHVIFGGLFLFVAFYAAAVLGGPGGGRDMPVEPVRLPGDMPGGGGHKRGHGGGKGIGEEFREDLGGSEAENDNGEYGSDAREPSADLKVKIKQNISDPAVYRYVTESKNPSTQAFGQLDAALRGKIRPTGPVPGLGKGGTGKGGGRGEGEGDGEGPGKGSGKVKLTAREKRMLRWHMRFTARTGEEYLSQLRALGAILAIPVVGDLKIVRDLRPGAKLLTEDVSKINRIYWIDNTPNGVRDVLGSLGLDVKPRPDRFIAFMPGPLEKRLYEMERHYVEKGLRRHFVEDKISETEFRVVKKGGRWQPEIVRVTLRD